MLDESTPVFATPTSHAATDYSGPLKLGAVEVAISAGTPATISAYAATYRHFCDWLHAVYGGLLPDGFTALELAVYRGWLRSAGVAPATAERRLAALQHLASHLALDPAIQGVGFDGRGVER